MTPEHFIDKWQAVELKERTAAQSHFNDLCALLGLTDPVSADPIGEWFTFEKGASKTSGGEGWADVWRKECFAWEYKGKRKDLDAAFRQLQQYAIALDNPPLLIVSDMDRVRIHTNWTNTVQHVETITLEMLRDASVRDRLARAFTDPESFKPTKTRKKLTEDAATKFVALAERLRVRGHDPQTVAHFVNRLVFCMYAEDVGLLQNKIFERLLTHSKPNPPRFEANARVLFAAMKTGGMVGFEQVEWFNGGLFDDDTALPLERNDIQELLEACEMDWSDIDPSILGTLFERGLDPSKRSQLGAHYTDHEKIMRIINPVIVEPLMAEWAAVKARIKAAQHKADTATLARLRARGRAEAKRERVAFLDRLRAFRVLDPACGSGNFLYVALRELKDIEHRVSFEMEAMGFPREFPRIGPEAVLGIELNTYAAELARVSVWIGEIQWMRRNGFDVGKHPILRKLDTIENRDAVLNPDGTRATWPKADVVVGNPPFLGDRKMIRELGEAYTETLRNAYDDLIPGRSDLVCYWFAQASEAIKTGHILRAGFVATNSISGGNNLPTLQLIKSKSDIWEAWRDEPWVVDGAAVRVSLIMFGNSPSTKRLLDGESVAEIQANLRSGLQMDGPQKLLQNNSVSFIGTQKNGPFDIAGDIARHMIALPMNPNGKSNSNVIRLWTNGESIVQRNDDRWVIDFGPSMAEQDAALFEAPFQYVEKNVKPTRLQLRRDWHRTKWWLHGDPRPALKRAAANKDRLIISPRVSKHRVFVWRHKDLVPDSAVVAIARDDDTTFGILHSRFHELWALRMGTSLEDRPRYTPSTTFETFPFPEGLTPNIPAADYAADPRSVKIAAAAARLNELRENWLNPPDLVTRVPEVVPGYPDRIMPVSPDAEKVLKTRTLTNLYNARPAWLDHAHKALDEAVAEAYGWGDEWRAGALTEDEILARLFRLNQERAAEQSKQAASE